MNILRDPKQVALNDLLVSVEQSVENYRDLAEVLDEGDVRACFAALASERGPLIARLIADIRQQDELPSEPDADKADLEKLVHRVRSALSGHPEQLALDEMVEAEQHTIELVAACRNQDLDKAESGLVNDVETQVVQALSRLQTLRVDR